ncbi:triple tyrosine motif-containing protein [Kozakia baliensis]|uniref:triple tyrosine motif-containing protein n=1 Tax=Kozakia baliensis TaxID=153496 RepID=UPI00345BDE2A
MLKIRLPVFFQCQPPSKLAPHESRNLRHGNPKNHASAKVVLGSLPIDGHILPYSRSPLTISFGFLNYRDDDHIRFRYKLDGFDENWEETTDGSVRYAKIDPGTYRFHLNAYNPWTQQSSSETSFIVQMAWPWWKTWTAYIFYGLILSICGYSIVRLRVRYLVRQKKILEEIISCQTAELAYRADHDRLTGLLNRAAIEDKLETRKNR